MALPSIVKTWQYDVNKAIAASTALQENRELLKGIVDSLLTGCKSGGGGASPWTVDYSCDSVAAGTLGDGVNRWDAITDLVWNASSNASWMVLKQSGVASGFRLLISLNCTASVGHQIIIAISPSAGFTGGTTTARPTATDELVLLNGTAWVHGTSSVARRYHLQQSADGNITRIFVCQANFVSTYMEFGLAASPRASWVGTKCYGVAIGSGSATTNAARYADLWDAAAAKLRHNGVNSAVFYTTEGCNDGGLGENQTGADDFDGAFPLTPVGLYGSTAGALGRAGLVYDLWFGSTGRANGDHFDELGSHTLVQLGHLVTPAGGQVWQTA